MEKEITPKSDLLNDLEQSFKVIDDAQKRLKELMAKKEVVNQKPFLKELNTFFSIDAVSDGDYGFFNSTQNAITDVQVQESDDFYEVIITTKRPGLLIGKSGIYINSLIEYMNSKERFDKEVKIKLVEFVLWNKLY